WIIDNTHISPFTHEALTTRNIDLRHTGQRRMPLSRQDLAGADRVVALKRDEHHRMIEHQFPGWQDRVDYWDVHDVDFAEPTEALPAIEAYVLGLIDSLQTETAAV
ncbi:MAG: NUDIX domain-containing protein, partial [Puniceicoccales bacterium]